MDEHMDKGAAENAQQGIPISELQERVRGSRAHPIVTCGPTG